MPFSNNITYTTHVRYLFTRLHHDKMFGRNRFEIACNVYMHPIVSWSVKWRHNTIVTVILYI